MLAACPPRARPMSPDERRADAHRRDPPLLRVHGRDVTTRQIAEAAGHRRGHDLPGVRRQGRADRRGPRRGRSSPATLVARIERDRPRPAAARAAGRARRDPAAALPRRSSTLMQKMGMVRPPGHLHDSEAAAPGATGSTQLLGAVVGATPTSSRVPVDHFVHVLRLLTFAGSHDHIADGRLLTPDEIVDTVLHGTPEEET